jgi:DNA-binding NarL/FixJ family response regulator
LRRLLESIAQVEVIGEAEDGRGVLDLVHARPADLVVSEFVLPDLGGCELAQQLRRYYPKTGVLFLSASQDAAHVRGALKCGAAGFLSKNSEPVELELALRACTRGQIYLSPCVSGKALEGRRAQRSDHGAVLTRRQREVLRMIGRGKSTKEIAQIMGLSTKTVETHRARLMQTLGLRGTSALMHFAVSALAQATEH